MITTITINRGSEWGIFANEGAFANWGEIDDPDADYDETYEMLGNMVVERFEAIAREHNCQCSWIPGSSEVIDDIDCPYHGQDEIETNTNDWLEQAQDEIFKKWCDGDIKHIKKSEV